MSNPCQQANDFSAAQAYVKYVGLTPRAISQADALAYAQRVGAPSGGPTCVVMAHLLAGRMMYWKNSPGDCPITTNVSLGLPGTLSKATGVAGAGLGATSTVGSLTGLAIPGIVGAAASVVGLVAIPLAIWSAISAHHKIAVAREQADLCQVAQAYNEWESAVEASIAAGSCSVTDAKNAVPSIEGQLMAAMQSIYKSCNAACIYQFCLRALDLYAVEKLYDSLSPQVAPSAGSLPGLSALTSTSDGRRFGVAAASGAAAFAFIH